MAFLEVKSLHKRFRNGQEVLHVLKGIDLSVDQGSFVLLLGPSGSGKTTLMNIIGTLDTPDEGEIYFEARDIGTIKDEEKDQLRSKDFGYVFQSVALMSNMNAYENVDFFLRINRYNKKERADRIRQVMTLVGLEKRMDHYPSQLSGGEQQRVAVARAIAHGPKLILADEPTAELDTATGLKVVSLFKEMVRDTGAAVVMCTHDRNLIPFADKVYHMEDGVITDVQ